ncbi:hypothetical protein ASPWEDRAFT_157674 [Aspergillus wentii DTO 134E9]|uniref:Pre-mRNA-splicing factor 38B n=1 Tax=Aspergillus wentii DTO 134E9 TaxID=1073089 RepID=A0A1L9RGT2_ASPWE|nr:uncharacterized protein ASPWEDRAFT_157674 [Aspergillus wentii DTO 134E9]OJJ34140.1 hypothetical protein ASPWEDRAFT_157674 [Aspergillus wentii DTO 134E9]
MPPNYGRAIGDPSDDDYVAQVLANEARDSSIKYSTEGLGAYVPKRPTGAAPKPNTRFLRHIIKETDSHNAALKRKEESEARERMRQLREQAASSSSHDARRHVSDDREPKRDRRECREDRHRSHRRRHRSRSASTDRGSSRKHRRKHEDYDTDEDRHRSSRRDRRRDDKRSHRRRRRSYSRSRSRSPRDERKYESRRSRNYKEQDTRSDHRSSREHRSSRRHTPPKEASPPRATLQNPQSEDESDPLEDLVGPLPPREDGRDRALLTRGRGAYKPNLSNIDAHFAPDYDPTLDIQQEDGDTHTGNRSTRRPVPGLMAEDDDWELALEAVRDRARWRQKGEERLRQAGFNQDTVDRWKSNPAFAAPGDTEGRPEDVKWSKKGEGREWDRGKFLDDDGHIDVKAAW